MAFPNDKSQVSAEHFRHAPEIYSHFRDDFRTAVFSGDEEALLRLAAHLQSCPECRTREVLLVERLSNTPLTNLETTACEPARSSLIRFLEQDRELTVIVLQHLLTCDICNDQLTDAARSSFTTEVHGDGETPAL